MWRRGGPGVGEREAPMESSTNLLARARKGDRDALDRLCHRHRPELRRWARGRLPRWARDAVDTDDLVQDVLMHTVNRIEEFEPEHDGALQAYLRQALQNRLRDEIRRRRRRPEPDSLDSQAPDNEPSPLQMAVGAQNLERYEAALASLRLPDRELIVLRLEMGRSYDEIALALDKPSPNAARMAVMRALMRLAEVLTRES
jgi:RNA polymerase sigma factor (sigma-70 family)